MAVIKKRKSKSHTPITLAIPKKVQDQIKKIPWDCLNQLRTNPLSDNSPTCWYTIAFRLKVGIDISTVVYTKENTIEMQKIYDLWYNVMNRFFETGSWVITDDEVENVSIGITATDDMTDETTRRIQLDAFHASDKYMKSILVEFNNKLLAK